MLYQIQSIGGISTHALLAEGDALDSKAGFKGLCISTHALLAEGDVRHAVLSVVQARISTHALLAEGDFAGGLPPWSRLGFQPTPSSRRATNAYSSFFCILINFNPRPPRGGRRTPYRSRHGIQQISTHALLAEGDARSPACLSLPSKFQPTPSSRRATCCSPAGSDSFRPHFNPRPPRGGRLHLFWPSSSPSKFQPTPSSRRATI